MSAILCHTSVGTDDAGMIWLCRCMLDESSEATVVEDAEYVKKFSSLVFTGTRAPLNTNFGTKCTKQLGTLREMQEEESGLVVDLGETCRSASTTWPLSLGCACCWRWQ